MKALEKDRVRRYDSAGALARDVRRYLDDEPVEACPPSAGYLLRKFASQNRKLLATAGAFVAVLVLGVVGLTWGIVAVNRALVREKEERERAEIAERGMRAGYNFAHAAIEALNRSRTKLNDDGKKLLRMVLAQEKELLRGDPGRTREARATTAARHFLVGDFYSLLGEPAEAEGRYGIAIHQYEQLADEFLDTAEYRNELARCYFNLAFLLNDQGKRPQANAAYLRAIELWERLAEDFPAHSGPRSDLADAHNDLGTVWRDQKQFAMAEKAFRQAAALGEKLVRDHRDFLDYRISLAANYHNLGNAVRDQRDAGASLAWYAKAIELLTPIKDRPANATLYLRNAHWDRANALGQLGRHAEASRDWERAADLDKSPTKAHLRVFLKASQMEEKLTPQSKSAAPLLYEAATVHALAAAAAAAENEGELKDRYAARALDLLKQAKAAGWFRDPQRVRQLKEDTAVAALPGVEAFLASLGAGKD
jgi:tetratricopeptide (TPR) repeat protein